MVASLPSLGRGSLLIGGEWRPPASGTYAPVVDPSTGRPIGEAPVATAEEARALHGCFERIGARIIGMWLVTEDEHEPASQDYDTVILLTRYESREHWGATRDYLKLGGEGPMYEACRKALERRRELTIASWLRWLDDGSETIGGPYYRDRVGF